MKVLVINIKYLGDLIVCSPGLRALRKTYPNDEIVFLLRKGFEDCLSSNPNVNRIISFDPALKGNKGIAKFIEGLKFIKNIHDEKFDAVIALQAGDRIALWTWFSNAKIKVGPAKQSFGKLFNKPVGVEEDSISYLEYYNRLFSALTGKIDSNETEFFVSENDEFWAAQFINPIESNNNKKIIAVHPGASEPSKVWPAENFIELIGKLTNDFNIILIEGPQDKIICDEIMGSVDGNVFHFQSGGIKLTAALLKKCDLLVAHDTGTRHLSVAVGTPVLALLPKDNLRYWNFYENVSIHHCLIGNRVDGDKATESKPYLNDIKCEDVYNKILGIMHP